jgi:hypothetical protein
MNKITCTECSKRVGFYGIKCRCVDATNTARIFCSTCINCKRFKDDVGHECNFDYKAQGRKELEKTNQSAAFKKVDVI